MMTVLRLRLILALCGLACAAAAWQVSTVAETAGSSLLLLAAGAALGLAVLGTLALALAPDRMLRRVMERVGQVILHLRRIPRPVASRLGAVLMGCGAILYAVILVWMVSVPDDPADDDQGAFLQTAAEVHESGGVLQLVVDLYAGRFAEANRHPLYIALLSLRPTFESGRAISVALGAATLLSLTLFTATVRSPAIAGVFCLLLGTNMAFCEFSTRVVCEVLMVFWGGAAYLLVARTSGNSFRWRDALLGGILGLAYLTKGTGQLMFLGAILWRVSESLINVRLAPEGPATDGKHGPGSRDHLRPLAIGVACLVFGWAVVASPLLVRNVRMYGSPTYNVNNWLLFVDTFEQPVPLSERQSLGEAARSYWESHTIGDVLHREVSGMIWEAFIAFRMLGPAPLDDARVLFGIPLGFFALIAVLARPGAEHVLLGWWTLLSLVVFAWYVPIAAGERFLVPLLAPLLILSAEGIVVLGTLGRDRTRRSS